MAQAGQDIAAFGVHGGRLSAARRLYPHAPAPWIDLSTGINPIPYPMPALSPQDWSRLPDPADVAALEALAAQAFGAEPQRVAATPGTEAALHLLPRLIGAGRVRIAAVTYGGHEAAWREAGADIAREGPAPAAVTVSPGNPDGAVAAPDLDDGVHILDEAFAEAAPGFVSRAPLAGTPGREGLIVLRSFGKAYGLAGVRLGFVIAEAALAARVRRGFGDWAVSGPALAVGRCAYADPAWLTTAQGGWRREAARLDQALTAAGFTILGGTDLFRLTRAPDAPARFQALLAAGILTRPFAHDPGLIRFGLPQPEAWPRLDAALAALSPVSPAHDR